MSTAPTEHVEARSDGVFAVPDRRIDAESYDYRVILIHAGPPQSACADYQEVVMLRAIFSFALVVLPVFAANAQTWPERPVKIIVPYAAGGGTDVLARVTADRLREILGQSFVVENRPGAGGMIGADVVAKSRPDGYTLLVSSPAEIAVNPHVFKSMTYDPSRDFAPVTLLAWTPLIITAYPKLDAKNPSELIAMLKSRPGQVNYSSPGLGSLQHIAGELLNKAAGVDMRHVPYRGAAPAVQDALAGNVPLTISGMPPVTELIKSGKLQAIGVTSARRSPLLPEVPALAELGDAYKDFDISNWFGLFTPAGVPNDILQKLHQAVAKALSDPAVRQRIAEQGAEAVGNTPEEFAAFIRAESERYGRIAKLTGIRVD
jgi:tripartite-type tricarboxylate transporter receptor subunit TctC